MSSYCFIVIVVYHNVLCLSICCVKFSRPYEKGSFYSTFLTWLYLITINCDCQQVI
nr:MAG TPA: hypothetical protein [Bacteriophage sp.]